jgi:hypothetical protein
MSIFVLRLQPLYQIYMELIQLILTQSTSYCSLGKSCCRRNLASAGFQHILLIPHSASSTSNTCMRHGTACFSQITMCSFKHTSVRSYLIRISMLIFHQCNERTSVAETIHESHICKLRISKSRQFCCCHCSLPPLLPSEFDNCSSPMHFHNLLPRSHRQSITIKQRNITVNM